ncbi:peptide chain release factor N(5)-glutamine methyltransferase [Lentibacillus sp. CBA3610]|uniref:peptide chain release factor N(5)-glutamine methyltransferase n=1 Tax=Lentibacillus sp. CBA3610 TaxID=2518176 RepID=UPI001595D955|nr:peptide chain release factor N(5)-glutamine methyltransferase [Lentibacillus sp. CBA3610]QKY71725.1 peptide chain release factor N(5)-glutamine methyltransferase [Lentibacillus sp. CBA3610]
MDKEPKLHEVLHRASLFLEENNREAKVAELLLQYYLGVSRSKFFMMMRDPVPEDVINQFNRAVTEHAKTGMPLEHMTGYACFYSRRFQVNGHTLIPRPETEELIQHIVETVSDEPHTIVDIGTGSGIIAVTLALELPNAVVYATDISPDALEIAGQNAERLGAHVIFLEGDYVEPLIEHHIQADIIVSNPPYIAPAEKTELSDTVKNFEPEQALFADNNGLASYKAIISRLPETLKQDGFCFFEIGHQQGKDVQSLLQTAFPEMDVAIIKDMNGKDRIISGTRGQTPCPTKN